MTDSLNPKQLADLAKLMPGALQTVDGYVCWKITGNARPVDSTEHAGIVHALKQRVTPAQCRDYIRCITGIIERSKNKIRYSEFATLAEQADACLEVLTGGC